MPNDTYLDHTATSALHPQVREAMPPFLAERSGTPSATYGLAKEGTNAIRALLTIAVLSTVLVACKSNGSKPSPTDTPVIVTVTQTINATPRLSAADRALAAEADSDPSLPGEYIDLPAIYGAPYPFGPPPPHQDGPIDYSAQGLPAASTGDRRTGGRDRALRIQRQRRSTAGPCPGASIVRPGTPRAWCTTWSTPAS